MNITKNIILDTAIKTLLIIAVIFCSGFAMVKYGQIASRRSDTGAMSSVNYFSPSVKDD